ncbi:DUF6221 family protein [Streptomyces aquilus]|uniref:DUF6221 family protein n=1 Tax=Streptomyces aquilus TaxID=2548456 RepID=UPI0037D337A7
MDDLVQWLRAQLDEDERIARAAASVRGPDWWFEGYFEDMDGQVLAGMVLDRGSSAVRSLAMTTRSDAEGEHAVRHDPARVLRQVDAERRLLDVHALNGWVCDTCDNGEVEQTFPCLTLRLLALPYADRPGYREEWRP